MIMIIELMKLMLLMIVSQVFQSMLESWDPFFQIIPGVSKYLNVQTWKSAPFFGIAKNCIWLAKY